MSKAAWVDWFLVFFVIYTTKFTTSMEKQEVEMTEWMKTFNFFSTGNIQMFSNVAGLWSPVQPPAWLHVSRAAPLRPHRGKDNLINKC